MAASQKIMVEVSGCRIAANYGDGATAATDITITGIKLGDKIIAAFHMTGLGSAGKVFKNILNDEITVTADDTVQCATTATNGTNEQVLVLWVPTTS